jgi:outer membrane receptor protein involved in Fe transport
MRHFDRLALQVAITAFGTLCAAQAAMAQGTPSATGASAPAADQTASAENQSDTGSNPPAAGTGQAQAANSGGGLQEIVVTAQRRTQSLQDVSISVTAFNQEQMDAQGVRSIDDIARLTPGITFQRADARNGADSTISIRGIASSAGAATTGIYIDDTPIQVRELGAGNAGFTAFPQIFDLDRIEVLRGPQGTLFGAGSEGGTVRFITPQPSLTAFSTYVRTELGYTQGGDPSYEAGVALGGPIIEGKVGVRVSAWFRRDGGWIDRTDWDHTSTEAYPPTAPTPASVTTTESPASNWQNSSALKAAFTFTRSTGRIRCGATRLARRTICSITGCGSTRASTTSIGATFSRSSRSIRADSRTSRTSGRPEAKGSTCRPTLR